MSQFKEFEGEFQPLRKSTLAELQTDKFILRLNRERNLKKAQDVEKPRQEVFVKPEPVEIPKKRRILLVGTNELNKKLNKRKTPKKKLTLVGTRALNEMLDRRDKHRQLTNCNADFDSMPIKRLKIKLIPFPKSEDSDDEFVDASLQFHYTSSHELGELEHFIAEEADNTEIIAACSGNSLENEVTDAHSDTQRFPDEKEDGSNINVIESSMEGEAEEVEVEEKVGEEHNVNKEGSEEDADGGNQDGGSSQRKEENQQEDNGIDKESHDISQRNDHQAGQSAYDVSATDIETMKQIIKPQISGLTFPLLNKSSLDHPYREIYSILEHTIKDHEGHSTLLVGPRGSGKTYIIDAALSLLRQKFHDLFITIKLNARLHSDDKLAIREIARQLDNHSLQVKLEDKVEGEDGSRSFEQRAINDTFTNILFTLDSNSRRKLHELKERYAPVVFIIDEIEKFTGGAKQTLLYNLFELSQSSKVPISVIGNTTKITTRELLERRVKSRFSQRIISIHRAPTIDVFWENAMLNLTVPQEEMNRFLNPSYPEDWNLHIKALFSLPSGLKKVIYKVFYTTKNYKDLYHCCQLPVAIINEKEPFPLSDNFEIYLNQVSPGYAQSIVESLSNLELLLTIAAARWIEKVDTPQVNFNLAYKEYTDMMKQANIEATTASSNSSSDNTVLSGIKVKQKIWSSKVMRDCWANIYHMGLLFDFITSNNEANFNNNYNMYRNIVIEDSKMLQLDISLEELGLLIDELTSYKKLTKL